ncbi:PREDICTED: glucose dehydrogenase [FAD, quinone]-like [Nicrophorus vespilloides]|uniref:Glucose dehydrogenase [FAD, quinone]-like n=1 Tax=Nicrophorus vespilloides TaxID=110193 RepID=A0ABM1MEK8_NICVS|nr:PREDICTED: glucose dehydrogenase [FAD, quinone]-like [Nicrophorus vespilloides]
MWIYLGFVLLILNGFNCVVVDLPADVVELIDTLERQLENPPEEPKLQSEYDFIIVGAGSAGCVIANRLSENPNWKILLIEAGTDEDRMMDVPLNVGYLQFSSINWNYTSEKDHNYCRGMNGGKCKWPRGKVMGGSSTLNYMIYTRGNREDYNDWAEFGNEGWSFDEVLPYFKKIENMTIPNLQNSNYHSTNGYMNVGYAPYKTPFADVVVEANKEFGLNYVDYNGASQIGVSRIQTNLKDGFRESANSAYIKPFNRINLHIKKLATVKKILIDSKKTAYGVEFVSRGRSTVVKARKEVIVSAGAINSPQLLMLSGIGPKKELKKHKIKVVADLPVGRNLLDHVSLPIVYTIDQPITIPLNAQIDLQAYLENGGANILSIPGGVEALSFHNLDDPFNPQAVPNIELAYLTSSTASSNLLYKDFNIKESVYEKIYKPIKDEYSFMIMPILLNPKSEGYLKLASGDYRDHPLIYANYFDDPDDLDTLMETLKLMQNITQQPAFKKIGAKLNSIPLDECPYKFMSDDYVRCMCRTLTLTVYHYSGTCKMGPKYDETSVVDDRLKVHGIHKLRVIDASIFPTIISGHTNFPTIMVAEKGADLIKHDHNAH